MSKLYAGYNIYTSTYINMNKVVKMGNPQKITSMEGSKLHVGLWQSLGLLLPLLTQLWSIPHL